MSTSARLFFPIVLACALQPGCRSADTYEDHANAVGARLVAEKSASIEDRPETVARPLEVTPPDETPAEAVEGLEAEGPVAVDEPDKELIVLDLERALEISIRSGREYLFEKEALLLDALALSGTRNSFSPILTTLLNYTFFDGNLIGELHSVGLTLGVSQILPWGGNIAADVTSGFTGEPSGSAFASGASVRYTQPLLRGSGHKISHEALIQAERTLMYRIREFERFRESYAIDVASDYYGLVQQKQSLENQYRNLEQLEFGLAQARAKFSMGEVPETDVLRTRRSVLTGQNGVLAAEVALELALDQFRVSLGLPDGVRIDVEPQAPEFVSVGYDIESAIAVALENRLDFLNEKDRLVDVERGLNIARNALQPNFDFDAGYGLVGTGGSSFIRQNLNDHTWFAGLSLEVPVERVNERNAYRAAQISLARAHRNLEQFEDNLIVSLRNRFRSIERIELSLEIQRQAIEAEKRQTFIATLLFEQGERDNRDVVEAKQSLLAAENALVDEQVTYEIERLNLLRDMGILFIDEKGMWTQ